MKHRQEGFTLIELLTVMLIVGLLAGLAANRYWSVKERVFKVAMRQDLRNVATQQERYFEKNMTYAASIDDLLDFEPSPSVTITITWGEKSGWAAIGTHASLPDEQKCGLFYGPAPGGSADPATISGTVACVE